MAVRNDMNIPFEKIVEIVRNLNEDLKEKLFKEVFLEFDTTPLTDKEKNRLKEAMDDYNKGETIVWQSGE